MKETNSWVTDYWASVTRDHIVDCDLEDIHYKLENHLITVISGKLTMMSDDCLGVYAGWTKRGTKAAVTVYEYGDTPSVYITDLAEANSLSVDPGDVVTFQSVSGMANSFEEVEETFVQTSEINENASYGGGVYSADGSICYLIDEGYATVVLIDSEGNFSFVSLDGLDDITSGTACLYNFDRIYGVDEVLYDLIVIDQRE